MLGLFKQRLPLSTFARVDIELLLRRNLEEFGRDAVITAPVINKLEELDLDTDSPLTLIDTAAKQVASRMNVRHDEMQFVLVDDPEFAFASTYESAEDRAIVRIHQEVTADPLRTTIEIANQVAHHHWLKHPSPRPLDHHARTTTLLPVCVGLGVLASNASLQESHWTAAGYSGWSMTRCGYYSAIEIGYAMALIAWLKGDEKPSWMQSLRLDAKKTAQAALNFFAKHQASGGALLFDATRIPGTDRDVTELSAWLGGEDPTFAMAAAYALAKSESLPTIATDAALSLTRSKDRELVVLAARLLGSAPNENDRIEPRIEALIADKVGAIALAALQSAGRRGMSLAKYRQRFEKLLADPTMDLIPLVDLIRDHPQELAFLSGPLCRQIELAIRYQDDEATTSLLLCLNEMVDDPIAEVERCIRRPDTREAAIEKLRGKSGDAIRNSSSQ